MNELIKKSAREIVKLLKQKKISPSELVDISFQRIKETDDRINAMPTLCVERARSQAKHIENNWPEADSPELLYGLPIGIKDLDAVAGVRMTQGSMIFKDHIPEESSFVVSRLEENMGITMGKNNTPEFGSGGVTFNEVFGITTNPWNISTTSGGSSGGAASSLAAGQVWLALGSDFAGSIRTPSAFCGTVGLRPTPGRCPCGPNKLPFSTLSVRGPMARTTGDVALMLDSMAGEMVGDPCSMARPEKPFQQAVDNPSVPKKIAISFDLGLVHVADEMKEACLNTAKEFEQKGATIVTDIPDMQGVVESFQILRAVNYAARMKDLLDTKRDLLKPDVVWNIEQCFKLTGESIAWAESKRGEIYNRFVEFFKTYDLLITPTTVTTPFDKNLKYIEELDGVPFDSYIGWLTPVFAITMTGCPSLSIPTCFSREGMPIGMQFVGASGNDHGVLSAGAFFEKECFPSITPIDPRG